MWLKTHLFSVMATKDVIPHADLRCCFPPCLSLRWAVLVEGFSVSKSLHFCSINVINSLSVGNPLSTCFICHLRRVWLSKHSTTSYDNMISSDSCSMFNAFSDLKLLQNVFTNCLISPMSSLLIDLKPKYLCNIRSCNQFLVFINAHQHIPNYWVILSCDRKPLNQLKCLTLQCQ